MFYTMLCTVFKILVSGAVRQQVYDSVRVCHWELENHFRLRVSFLNPTLLISRDEGKDHCHARHQPPDSPKLSGWYQLMPIVSQEHGSWSTPLSRGSPQERSRLGKHLTPPSQGAASLLSPRHWTQTLHNGHIPPILLVSLGYNKDIQSVMPKEKKKSTTSIHKTFL